MDAMRVRMTSPMRVAGIFEDGLDLGGLGDAAKGAAQGISDAAKDAGAGIRQGAQGIGEGAQHAGTGVSDAASLAADTAALTAKVAIALAIGIPVLLVVAGVTTLVLVGRGAARTAEKLGPDALRVAPELLPLLLPLLGPEGAAAGAAASMMRAPRQARTQDVREAFQLTPAQAASLGADPSLSLRELPGGVTVGSWGPSLSLRPAPLLAGSVPAPATLVSPGLVPTRR